jgi:mannose/cellobiose epimerase-like protein (N-acyl-D-glucosamine 2-epimerase family)
MRSDRSKEVIDFVEKCRILFPALLKHCFKLGFAPKAGGIVKTYDLCGRQPVNTDMPWWSLPETIRAAAEVYEFSGDKEALDILQICTDAFLNNYINPDVYHMAYQTRNAKGKVVKVIPATPDADPGYHTGLSLIDAIKIMQN